MVVPISFRMQFELFIISGNLKEPPISMSSPRLIITSLRLASVFKTNMTAAALLFTIVTASAPNKWHNLLSI